MELPQDGVLSSPCDLVSSHVGHPPFVVVVEAGIRQSRQGSRVSYPWVGLTPCDPRYWEKTSVCVSRRKQMF